MVLYWAAALLDGPRHAQAPEGIPDNVCCEVGKVVTRVVHFCCVINK